jgi:mono/diheme cytochrome c family protein
MRTNLTGFILTVGMALTVVMLGFLGLSAAGLVGFAAEAETIAAQAPDEGFGCATKDAPADSSANVPLAISAEATAGEALFKANCVQCHAVNEKVVGPALAGITKRRPASWVVAWVRNPAKVIASGDEYAAKLFNDYGKQQMPSFGLSEKEITAIIIYVEETRDYKVVVN